MADLFQILFFAGRLILGSFFIFNAVNHFRMREALTGYAQSKGVPFSGFGVPFSGLMILFGGLSFIFGFYPKIGVLLVSVFLLVISFSIHNFWALSGDDRMLQQINFMKNMALLGACLMFLAIPEPWPLSFGF